MNAAEPRGLPAAQGGVEKLQMGDGRAALAKAMELGSSDPEVDGQTFDNLVRLVAAALECIHDNDDSQNASAFMKLVGTFYTTDGGARKALSEQPQIKSAELWTDMKFWQDTIFEVVSAEREKAKDSDDWTNAGEEEREIKLQQEQNVAFQQIMEMSMQMLDFGNTVEAVVGLIKKLQTLQVLTSPEHIQMLGTMLGDKAGRAVDIMADGELGGMVDSRDPVAEAHAQAEEAQRAREQQEAKDFREAETEAVKQAEEQLSALLHPGPEEDGSKDERVVANAGRVGVRLMDGTVYGGVLFVTSYRLAFISPELKGVVIELPILSLLDTNKTNPEMVDGLQIESSLKLAPGSWGPGVELDATVLKVVSKDVRQLYFIFSDDVVQLLEATASGSEGASAHASRLLDAALARKAKAGQGSALSGLTGLVGGKDEEVQSPTELRAKGFTEIVEQVINDAIPQACEAKADEYNAFRHRSTPADEEGKVIYNARAEFTRQGALKEGSGWRETKLNESFELCATYPQVLLFPEVTTDEEISEVAKFRSKQRLPSFSWVHPANGAAIVRCAQPLVGLTGKKSEADEKLFTDIQKANGGGNGVSMMDARPWANAVANKGRKGGYEKLSLYEDSDATLTFLNIDNIHVMRNSLYRMQDLVRQNERGGAVSRADIQETGWPAYVGRVNGGAATIVKEIEQKGRTCVVHCSDGWDRTAQLAAVPAMCMDPYYRTMRGFQILVQREWNSFGHKFRDRTYGKQKRHERSPIFTQFLDCVQNVMYQYPKAFEFNEYWLLELHDALYSMAYSDFRCNHEKGTVAEREDRTPAQVWSLLYGERADEFRNAAYDPEADERVLMPPVEARTWVGYFNRWTEDPIRGKPGSLLNAPNEHTLERPKRTFEELLMNASKPPVPALCVEKPYRHSGWLWQVSGKLKKEKHRWCILHEFVQGEASLVYYEEEKSQSTVPMGIIPLHEGSFSVASLPERTDDESLGTERTYFQLRWKTEGDAAAREAAKEEMEVLTVILEHCTANSQDKMAEVELEKLKQEAATASHELSDLLAKWLARRLASDATPTRVKTLTLIDKMVDQGNGAFRSSMKTICQTSIDNCKTFSAPPDPVAGDKPVALVRKLSEKVSAKVLNSPVAEQAAGAPEVRTVFSAEEAQYEGWVEAFKAAAGQDEVPVADETVAEDALDMGLKAASSAVEVMGAGADMAAKQVSAAAGEVVKYTKKFSGKATAPILGSEVGTDEGVHYQLSNSEITVKAKKKETIRWDLEGGWRIRWKLVCGPHNVGYTAYFVTAPHARLQTPKEVEGLFAELQPMLEACTANDESKPPAEVMDSLSETVGSATRELSDAITSWLSKRSTGSDIPVKLKTINLMRMLCEAGNGDYKLSTKVNCISDVQACKAFIAMADPVRGDKPRDMVRRKASELADKLAAMPDEARDELCAPPACQLPCLRLLTPWVARSECRPQRSLRRARFDPASTSRKQASS